MLLQTIIYIIVPLVIAKIVYKLVTTIYDGVECLAGKVVIITGGNKGIGFEVSKHLASRGCKIIIACRSNAENERRQIVELTHNENIFVKYLDLQSFESVRNFAEEIHETEDKIDILINNAGIGHDYGFSADGLHPVMQTNVFSPFLLTHLLADLLKRSNDGRIIFSASIMAFYNNLTLDNLNLISTNSDQRFLYHLRIYGNSKLAQIIISNMISEKLMKYGIKSNALHPGVVSTALWQPMETVNAQNAYDTILKWIIYIFLYCYSQTAQEGAQSIVALAASDKFKNVTGQFYWGFGMKSYYPNPRSLGDSSFCTDIWNKIESLVNLKQEEKL